MPGGEYSTKLWKRQPMTISMILRGQVVQLRTSWP